MALEKVVLDGESVRLEPLEECHRAAIRPAAQHPEIFTVTTSALGPLYDPYIDNALKRSDGVRELAFAVPIPLHSDFDCLKVGDSARALLSCSYGPRASRSLMIMSGPEARGPEDDEGYTDGTSNGQHQCAELPVKAGLEERLAG